MTIIGAFLLSACAQAGGQSCTAPLKPALEVDLYFGRDRQGGGEVSDVEWAAFLNEVVTPRFPAGFTVLDGAGQTRAPSGTVVRERSKLLVVVVFDAPAHQRAVGEIVAAYGSRFAQDGVFRVEKPVCAGT